MLRISARNEEETLPATPSVTAARWPEAGRPVRQIAALDEAQTQLAEMARDAVPSAGENPQPIWLEPRGEWGFEA